MEETIDMGGHNNRYNNNGFLSRPTTSVGYPTSAPSDPSDATPRGGLFSSMWRRLFG